MSQTTLYERLGGHDAISAVCSDLWPRLQADAQLARLWQARGDDGLDLPGEEAAWPQRIDEAVPTLRRELAERRCLV